MYTIINIVLLLVIIKLVYSLNWEGYTREQLDELSRLLDASFRGPNGQYPIDITQPLPSETDLYNEVRSALDGIRLREGQLQLSTEIRRPNRYDVANFALSPHSIVTKLTFEPNENDNPLRFLLDMTENLYDLLDRFCDRLIDVSCTFSKEQNLEIIYYYYFFLQIFKANAAYLYVCYFVGSRSKFITQGRFQNLFDVRTLHQIINAIQNFLQSDSNFNFNDGFYMTFNILSFHDIASRKLQAPNDLRFGGVCMKNFGYKQMMKFSHSCKLLCQQNNKSVLICPLGYIAFRDLQYNDYVYSASKLRSIFNGEYSYFYKIIHT